MYGVKQYIMILRACVSWLLLRPVSAIRRPLLNRKELKVDYSERLGKELSFSCCVFSLFWSRLQLWQLTRAGKFRTWTCESNAFSVAVAFWIYSEEEVIQISLWIY